MPNPDSHNPYFQIEVLCDKKYTEAATSETVKERLMDFSPWVYANLARDQLAQVEEPEEEDSTGAKPETQRPKTRANNR